MTRAIYAATTNRITIETGSGTGTAGGSISVKALMRVSEGGPISVGEGAQFVVSNPRSGDRCDTNAAPSDNQGYVYGTCYASGPGTVAFYARSLNGSDDRSNDSIITFISGPTPTNTPTATPTPTTSLKKTITPTEEPTPTEEVAEEETPTPTPEAKTAGFFSNPLSMIGLLIVLIFLGAGGFILWKEKKFPFNKFQLKKIKKTPPEQPPA